MKQMLICPCCLLWRGGMKRRLQPAMPKGCPWRASLGLGYKCPHLDAEQGVCALGGTWWCARWAEPVWFASPGHRDLSSALILVLAAPPSPLAASWSVRPERTLLVSLVAPAGLL